MVATSNFNYSESHVDQVCLKELEGYHISVQVILDLPQGDGLHNIFVLTI